MTRAIRPAPVRKSITVAAPPARAFEIFTARQDAWWPRSHTIGASPTKEVVLERKVGGRWFGRLEDGSEQLWGDVLVWSPPERLVLAWRIGADWIYDSSLLTEVEVTFTEEGSGTRVDLEHRMLERMGDRAEGARAAFDSDGGWMGLLRLFAELAERT